MNILLIGPQGSGKGTQAEKLVDRFHLAYVSMGDILRNLKGKDTPLAQKATEYVEKGILVPDEITIEVLNEYLANIGKLDGIVFDGFPRVVSQARYFENFLEKQGKKIDVVFFLSLTKEEILKRLAGRRICEKCGRVYNLLTDPPQKEGICDKCREKLVGRSDETPEVIETRLNEFWTKTKPLVEYYRERGILEEIDGNRPIEVIFEDIVERLKKRGLIKDV